MQLIVDGYTAVPEGRLAAVVTYLEMRQAPPLPTRALSDRFRIEQVHRPDLEWYRRLFRAIGEDWLWFSRLRMSDEELRAILHHAQVETFVLMEAGEEKGLLELDSRRAPDAELSFFGLMPDMIGKGAGNCLMEFALRRVWSQPIERFWLRTCSLDHPRALAFYRKWGFVPYKREIEVAPDPRLTGDLPRSAAPQIPLIEPAG